MKYKIILTRKMSEKMDNEKQKKTIESFSNLNQRKTYLKPFINFYELILLLKIIIFFNIIIIFSANAHELRMLESHDSYITLNISKKGNQTFLGDKFKYFPDKLYVNGNIISGQTGKYILLNETINQIKLVWFNDINNTDYMFYGTSNIEYIDLSHFNSSLVRSMNSTFSKCNYLKSIDFSNIDTSLVTSMESMFESCSDLVSLDLTGFKTSNVVSMKSMFKSCKNIKSLVLSSFDTSQVQNMEEMFCICSSLKVIDISSFDTSSVTTMNFLFYRCSNLIEINLSNFNTPSLKNISNMFD